ncbi:MAG: hypothetical protein QXU18_14685 [Thermoplasmatales archaeon]
MVQERRQNRKAIAEYNAGWNDFVKGADGLIVEQISRQDLNPQDLLRIHGIIEVKSMARPTNRILKQIESHEDRLAGGVKLGTKEWPPESVVQHKNLRKGDSDLIYVIVVPSTWKLSREWKSVKNDSGSVIMLFEPYKPKVRTQVEEPKRNLWKITLAWSQEELSEAAYEMTFWYMSQVGKYAYRSKKKQKTGKI